MQSTFCFALKALVEWRCGVKKQLIWTAVLATAFLCLVGCGQKKPAETEAKQQSSAAQQTEATASQTAETEETHERELQAVIVAATMNELTVQTEQGELLTIATGASAKEKADMSGLANGVVTGHGVKLTGRMEEGHFVLLRAEDKATRCGDADALAAAGNVMLCVREKNLQGLASYADFPLYVGIGSGTEVTSEEELLQQFTAEQIFTPEFVEAVTGTDLMSVEAADSSLVISRDGGKPNIVISRSDDGWGVTGINHK